MAPPVMLRPFLLIAASLLVWLHVGATGQGEPANDEQPTEQSPAPQDNERRKTVEREAESLKISLDDDPKAPVKLHPEPVLRWPNHERGGTDGATFIWTVRGQPVAMACIWWADDMQAHLALHSLTDQPIRAEHGGNTIWHSMRPGVEYHDVPGAGTPASSEAARLNQMRGLAREFRGALVSRNQEYEQLRLLPQPLYCYGTEDSPVEDGAIFAFVTGTDPETILQIEARRDEAGTLRWQYAVTRRTSVALRLRHRDTIVWTVRASQGASKEPFFITPVAARALDNRSDDRSD